jgi:2-amino-4-hydroxy-6-hydroxymethyldihydropteridine diphosphokinase
MPMGSQAGPPYLNSICGMRTSLAPKELLRVLQAVENQLGRVRDVRWGPRTLDLDLISYGDEVVNDPDLIVPHPSFTYRRFVLDPLVEVASDWRHPLFSESAAQMLERLRRRPLLVELLDVSVEEMETLADQLRPQFSEIEFVFDAADSLDVLTIRMASSSTNRHQTVIDLTHSPGSLLEQLTSAFTVIFDRPERISDW